MIIMMPSKRETTPTRDSQTGEAILRNSIGWFIGGSILLFCIVVVAIRMLDSMRYRAAIAEKKQRDKQEAAVQEIYGKDVPVLLYCPPPPPAYEENRGGLWTGMGPGVGNERERYQSVMSSAASRRSGLSTPRGLSLNESAPSTAASSVTGSPRRESTARSNPVSSSFCAHIRTSSKSRIFQAPVLPPVPVLSPIRMSRPPGALLRRDH